MFQTILTVFVAGKKKCFHFNIRCIRISNEEDTTLVFGPLIIIIPWNAPDIFSREKENALKHFMKLYVFYNLMVGTPINQCSMSYSNDFVSYFLDLVFVAFNR